MCKFFAYGYPCRWMKRNNECRQVHDEGVRNAFDAYKEKAKKGENLTCGELRKLIDPENQLTDDEYKVQKLLYMKYPRPPTKKERVKIEEEKDKIVSERLFQKMHGMKEDTEAIPTNFRGINKNQRRQFCICKYFAHNYPCHWELKRGGCTFVHDTEVKSAFDEMMRCRKEGSKFTIKMRDNYLNPTGKRPINEL